MADTAEHLVKVTVRVPASLVKRAKIRAVEQDADLQDIVRKAVEQYLKGGK